MFPYTHTPTPCVIPEEISGMRSSGKTGAFRQLVPAVGTSAGAFNGVAGSTGDKCDGPFFSPLSFYPPVLCSFALCHLVCGSLSAWPLRTGNHVSAFSVWVANTTSTSKDKLPFK